MSYGDFNDLARRTASDKVLREKAFNIAKNPRYDGYQRGLSSMVYKFFDKKNSAISAKKFAGGAIKFMSNQRPLDLAMQQLAEKLYINQLLKSLEEVNHIHHLKTIFI